jgi:hypothetical protein
VDYAEMRDARTQYLNSMGSFVQAMTPLLQAKPETAPFMLEMLRWGMVGFKGGKSIEGVMDQAIKAASAPPQPDPKQEAETAKTAAEVDRDKASAEKSRADASKANAETLLMFGAYPPPPGAMPPGPLPPHAGMPPEPPAPGPQGEPGPPGPPAMPMMPPNGAGGPPGMPPGMM